MVGLDGASAEPFTIGIAFAPVDIGRMRE